MNGDAGHRRFDSILFAQPHQSGASQAREAPAFFHDLNLDQIVATVTADFQEYDLVPFFQIPLSDPDAITYRQQVMRELERTLPMQAMQSFAATMRAMRKHLEQAGKCHYRHERTRWFLNATEAYCDAVERLDIEIREAAVVSTGLRSLSAYLAGYVDSAPYVALALQTRRVLADLGAVSYCLLIKGNSITVRACDAPVDLSAAVEETFEKFRRGAVRDYRAKFPKFSGMNHVEAQVLDRVALFNPQVFAALDSYCTEHAGYLDETIARFDREVHFYLAYLRHIDRIRAAGLPFCYPELSRTSKEIDAAQTFDLALADKRVAEKAPVVCNDFALRGAERILVVSGPNNGGKTTFARMFGQLHYLAALGCAVPGDRARLFLFDRLFAHFERQEDIATLRGKLQDDLVRMHRILSEATPNSIVVMNEIFSSTTLHDAVYLSEKVIAKISELDLLAVCVTFLSELAVLNEKTVSMVSTIDPGDAAVRTYRVERRPADGLAYATAIAEKYRVTYAGLTERIRA